MLLYLAMATKTIHACEYNYYSMLYMHSAIFTCEGLFVTAHVHQEKKINLIYTIQNVDNNLTIASFQ